MIIYLNLGNLKESAPYRLTEFSLDKHYINYILINGNASPSYWYAKRLLGV